MQEKLKIIQWNCRSVHAKGRFSELIVLLYDQMPHIACISETWLHVNSKTLNIKGYKILRKDRVVNNAGGLMFLIREDVNFNNFTVNTILNSRIEAQAIEISLGRDSVQLLHIYNPVTSIEIEHLKYLIRQLGRKFILVGDFNGHHTLWDPNLRLGKINSCGRSLANFMLGQPDLALITTPGLKTYTHTTHTGSNSSTLDLAFCTNNLINVSETKLLGDSGSDHTPVLINISIKPDKIIRNRRPKWKLNREKVPLWKDKVLPQRAAPTSLEEEVTNFNNLLTKPAEVVFGKSRGNQKSKYNKPWWTTECARVVAQRRRAKKLMERRPTASNVMEFRRLSGKAKRIIKSAKRESWRRFCQSLSAETPSGTIWKVIRSMNGKGKSSASDIPLEENGMLIPNASTKANILADQLEGIIGADPAAISEEEEETIHLAKNSSFEDQFNRRFTLEELTENIRDLPSNKATGNDDVHNLFLKNLPDHTITELLGLINRSWRRSEVPASWRHSLVIPILKNGKPASEPNSYRPVSLISCVSKLMEKMVAGRLYWQLEKQNKLKNLQSGFRKGRSTEDLILKIEHTVRATLVNQKVNMSVFFDLKQAFDNVNHNLLLYKAAKAGINGRMLCWLEKFLDNRTFQYIIDNSKSQIKSIKRGLPQGSALSPLLFNIMMIDLPFIENVEVMDFADDIAITATAKTVEEAGDLIERAIRALER